MGQEIVKSGKSGKLAMPSLLVVVIGLHVLAGKVECFALPGKLNMHLVSPSLPPAKRLRGAQFRYKAQAEGVGGERKSSDAGGDTRIRADRFAIPAPELLRPSVVGVGMGGVQEYYSLEEIVAALQFTLLSPSTLLWGFVGVLSVHVCGEYLHLYYDMNFSIVASGLIFPKSFAISNAFGRREFALRTLARMKATSASLLWTFRDWDLKASRLDGPNTTTSMAVNSMSSPAASTAYLLLQELHLNIRAYVQADRCASEAEVVYYYDNVYKCLSTLSAYGNLASQSNFGWKNDKPPPTVIEGHPRLLAEGFEQLRVVRDYRTPRGFHLASVAIFYCSIVFLSPYWLHFCPHIKGAADSVCPASYFNSICFTVVVDALFRVHDALENPFDQSGLDDIHLSTVNELRRIHTGEAGYPDGMQGQTYHIDSISGEIVGLGSADRFQEYANSGASDLFTKGFMGGGGDKRILRDEKWAKDCTDV